MRSSICQNSNKNIVRISVLKVFIASLGLPVGFFIYDITHLVPRKPQKASKKLPESYTKFQGRNFYNIFVAILDIRCLQTFILWV